VILLSKGPFDSTNTAWAQGGIAGVLREDDSIEAHAGDTIEAGGGLCDERAVRFMVEAGAGRLAELIEWGARFDRDPASGELSRGREGGHTASRVYHADGDATGREIQRLLVERARATDGVRIFESCYGLDLITPSEEPGSPVQGAVTHHARYGLQMIWAKTTILASGGAGQLFRETTNPHGATADGLAMAYRAGATLADLAFVQFHPTTLYLPGAHRALITEAVRGEGGLLLDSSGHRFMPEVHEMAELAPRDVVSHAIVNRIAYQGGSHVLLDCRGIDGFAERCPGIDALFRRFGLDASADLIPVHPAAHYMIGGVRTDRVGGTDVPGLLAVGEIACTGLHGANRLASNSLLEGLVAGARAGQHARDRAGANGPANGVAGAGRPAQVVSDIRPSDHGEIDLSDIRSSLRSAMWRNVGISRTGSKLHDANEMFDFWARYTLDKIFDDPEAWETQNLLMAGALVARSAAWREESRGCHNREDFPLPVPDLAIHDLWRRGWAGPVTVARDELFGGAAEGAPAVGLPGADREGKTSV